MRQLNMDEQFSEDQMRQRREKARLERERLERARQQRDAPDPPAPAPRSSTPAEDWRRAAALWVSGLREWDGAETEEYVGLLDRLTAVGSWAALAADYWQDERAMEPTAWLAAAYYNAAKEIARHAPYPS